METQCHDRQRQRREARQLADRQQQIAEVGAPQHNAADQLDEVGQRQHLGNPLQSGQAFKRVTHPTAGSTATLRRTTSGMPGICVCVDANEPSVKVAAMNSNAANYNDPVNR